MIGVDLTGTTDAFLFASSSDESESDEESFFFLLLGTLAGCGTAGFFATGVTFATNQTIKIEETIKHKDLLLFGVDGGCFLLAGGATSSESELELLDVAALRLFDWVDVATTGLADGVVGAKMEDDMFSKSLEIISILLFTSETC